MELGTAALKNTVTLEWPDYLIRNPYTAIRDQQNQLSLRLNRDLSKEQPHAKVAKTINVNMKYGMSRDTPFETVNTHIYASSKGIMNKEEQLSKERKNVMTIGSKL